MKTEQIIKTLKDHNDWRRGVGKWDNGEKANYFDTISAYELGQTIDAAIERLQTLEQERDEARNEATLYRNACYALNDKDCELLPWEKGNE
jgi:hypothetical protein